MQKFNLDYIDSMRGIAIFMVLAVHSTLMLMLIYTKDLIFNIEKILISGKYGVALFFLVSAYTLFRSIHTRKEQGYKKYLIRRFFRIIPLYFIILFIVSIIVSILLAFYNNGLINSSLIYWLSTFIMGIRLYQNEQKLNIFFVKNKNAILFLFFSFFILFSYIEVKLNYLIFSILLFIFFILNKYNKIIIFNNFIIKKIGELSFSIYLIHMPIFSLIKTEKLGGQQ